MTMTETAPPLPRLDVLARERKFQAMCARVAHTGFRLDPEHITAKIAEYAGAREAARARVGELTGGAITNPSSTKEVPGVLGALGVPLGVTPAGKPSAAKAELERLAGQPGYEHADLLKGILEYRHDVTTLGLLLEPLNLLCTNGDGRMRPTVYTINADTGRTCIPGGHGLVTPDGFVKSADVQPGMLTMDAAGNWIRVTGVHRYAAAPLLTLDSRGLQLAATPEHRWITTLEHRPGDARELRRLGDRPRLRIHLAPETEPFDFSSAAIPAQTDAQRLAALIGMLVTDGLCRDYGPGTGLRATVYQTERKSYAEFLRVIPEAAVMYDRHKDAPAREIAPGRNLTAVTDHHEIRIKARWLRRHLDEAGLPPDGLLLKDSPALFAWAARLPLDGLRAFFAACWLSDGTLWQKGRRKSLSCGSANLRQVLALAACRLGLVAYEFDQDGGRAAPRMGLAVREAVISTHRNPPAAGGTADVWCVTTETGTFSAVSSQGMVYVTGNSCVRPNGQQFSRQGGIRACVIADEGMLGISADFSGVEIRVGAALSGDQDLLAAELSTRCLACTHDPCSCGLKQTGLHWMAARMAWGEGATKENRYAAKRIIFSKMFGGSPKAGVAQTGVTWDAAKAVHMAFENIAPGFKRWDEAMRAYVDAGNRGYQAYSGRTIWLPRGRAHAAGNFAIQGSARELLVDGVLRWSQTRWGHLPLLPIHDEVFLFVPAAEAAQALEMLQACMRTSLAGVAIEAAADLPFTAWPDSS